MLLLWKDPRQRGKFRPGYSPAYGARRDRYLRVVANALGLAHVAAGHDVKTGAVFSKPCRRGDLGAILTEGGERNVFPAAQGGGDCSGHARIVAATEPCHDFGPMVSGMWLARVVRRRPIAPALSSVLKALHMRKWMRERLTRRKKTPQPPSDQPAPPPLQPAYFDAEQQPGATSDAEVAAPAQEAEVRAARSEPLPADEQPSEPPAATPKPMPGGSGQSGRGRRRRGGRGRGGRGREQAVAQAFAPAAAKGSIPVVPVESDEEELPAAGDAEAEAEAPVPTPAAAAPKVPAAPAAPQRAPKGVVVLAIGLPGSGKSSWFKRHNVVPLSSDMVRSLLFDDVREQRFQDLVFSNLRSMLKARLIAKRPMNYVDATNLTPQERQHWIKLAKDYQYEVHAVFFDVPLEVCIERHQRRDRVVPEDVMRRMAAKLKPPAFDEGFAKITVVRVKKKEPEAG